MGLRKKRSMRKRSQSMRNGRNGSGSGNKSGINVNGRNGGGSNGGVKPENQMINPPVARVAQTLPVGQKVLPQPGAVNVSQRPVAGVAAESQQPYKLLLQESSTGLERLVQNINQSKYFAGIIMILMNMGSKYISLELSDRHESILGHPMVRRIMLFTVFFTATRDIWISLILTACFIILITGVFHDNSRFCMIPKKFQKSKKHKNSQRKVSDKEVKQAKEILEIAEKQKSESNISKKIHKKEKQQLDRYFLNNLENFKNYKKKRQQKVL